MTQRSTSITHHPPGINAQKNHAVYFFLIPSRLPTWRIRAIQQIVSAAETAKRTETSTCKMFFAVADISHLPHWSISNDPGRISNPSKSKLRGEKFKLICLFAKNHVSIFAINHYASYSHRAEAWHASTTQKQGCERHRRQAILFYNLKDISVWHASLKTAASLLLQRIKIAFKPRECFDRRDMQRQHAHSAVQQNAPSAKSMALFSAIALFTVSSYSRSVFESSTIPAPAWR